MEGVTLRPHLSLCQVWKADGKGPERPPLADLITVPRWCHCLLQGFWEPPGTASRGVPTLPIGTAEAATRKVSPIPTRGSVSVSRGQPARHCHWPSQIAADKEWKTPDALRKWNPFCGLLQKVLARFFNHRQATEHSQQQGDYIPVENGGVGCLPVAQGVTDRSTCGHIPWPLTAVYTGHQC